jgi:adenine-specific DNA glycosylase
VDKACQRVVNRLGIHEEGIAELRGVLERAVPKNRGPEFLDLIEDLANDTCVEGEPDCPRCELRKICPTAAERKLEASQASARGPAPAKSSSRKATATPSAHASSPDPAPTAPAPPPTPEPKSKPQASEAKSKKTPPATPEVAPAPAPQPKATRGKTDRSKS